MTHLRSASLALVLLVACNKEEASTKEPTTPAQVAQPDPNADLTSQKWAGKMHSSAGAMIFKSSGDALTAEWAYQLFGRVIITDRFAVTRAADGTITLKGLPGNKLIGGGRFPLSELVGRLSEDKTLLAGTHTLPQGEIKWFVSTKQTLADLDPPLAAALAEEALTKAGWEGTIGNKPIKMTFTKKDTLTGELTAGKDKFALDVSVDGSGKVTLVAAPKPTPQGLLSQTFVGYFGTNELARISGTQDASVKQGFVEQGGSEAFVIERQESAPVKAGKRSKK